MSTKLPTFIPGPCVPQNTLDDLSSIPEASFFCSSFFHFHESENDVINTRIRSVTNYEIFWIVHQQARWVNTGKMKKVP